MCIVQMIVLPRAARFLREVTTLSAMNESSPDVGSSQNNKDGFVRVWQTMAHIFTDSYKHSDNKYFVMFMQHKTLACLNPVNSKEKWKIRQNQY